MSNWDSTGIFHGVIGILGIRKDDSIMSQKYGGIILLYKFYPLKSSNASIT